jgi:hypothetical protein
MRAQPNWWLGAVQSDAPGVPAAWASHGAAEEIGFVLFFGKDWPVGGGVRPEVFLRCRKGVHGRTRARSKGDSESESDSDSNGGKEEDAMNGGRERPVW